MGKGEEKQEELLRRTLIKIHQETALAQLQGKEILAALLGKR
jgi:hypothetical protein